MIKRMFMTIVFGLIISISAIGDEIKPLYNVYHMGAKWCSPCEKMKQTTWKDENLIKYMKENGFKLYMYDADKEQHKKHFNYYKVDRYPTLIILDRDNLRTPLSKTSGYKSANSIKSILESMRKK